MPTATNLPNWDELAKKFDHWLPHLAPVTEVLIRALQPLPGNHILDIACGTGEPALSLARLKIKDTQITATDNAMGMVHAGRYKAQQENLQNITFECVEAEKLPYQDRCFDKVICRFGIMLLDDPTQGLKEIHRTLKAQGRFAFAVWSSPKTMTTLQWAYHAFLGRIPDTALPPVAAASRLGSTQLIKDALSTAGFNNFTIETHCLNYHFASFDDYWHTVEASDIMKRQLAALYHPEDKQDIIEKLRQLSQAYTHNNALIIPHEYLIAHGTKT